MPLTPSEAIIRLNRNLFLPNGGHDDSPLRGRQSFPSVALSSSAGEQPATGSPEGRAVRWRTRDPRAHKPRARTPAGGSGRG